MSPRRWPHAYGVLHVHHEASADELEVAYVDRLAEVSGDPAGHRAVTAAWALLGDPERRAAYDRQAVAAASVPARDLAAAVRPLVVWLVVWLAAFVLAVAVVYVGLGFRDPWSIVGAAVLAASAPFGWWLLGGPFRWLELDRGLGACAVRVILASAFGPFFVIGWPLLRLLVIGWTVAAPELGELGAVSRRAGR